MLRLQIRGVDGIDPTTATWCRTLANVTGVVLNVIGITGSSATPPVGLARMTSGGVDPATSNLNLPPNQIKANLVFVPVGADGNVRIYNNQGATDVVVDVVGYMQSGQDAATARGRVVPLSSPFRMFDTRDAAFGAAPLGPGMAEDWSFAAFAQRRSHRRRLRRQADSRVIGNLTRRRSPAIPRPCLWPAFLTAYPGADAAAVRRTSTRRGPAAIPNMAVLKYGADNTVQRLQPRRVRALPVRRLGRRAQPTELHVVPGTSTPHGLI